MGFTVFPGQLQVHGMDKKIFNKFDRVYSGHYHTRSDDGKIFYLGNPYQMFWNDYGDDRGFHIFDTENYDLTYLKNPYNMFEKLYYEDSGLDDIEESKLENKIVKVVIRKRSNQKQFEKFLDKIIHSNPMELKVVDIIDIDDSNVEYEEDDIEDTLTILDKYIEDSDFNLNKNKIKDIIREIYKEALEVE
jgi:hypothetical protein